MGNNRIEDLRRNIDGRLRIVNNPHTKGVDRIKAEKTANDLFGEELNLYNNRRKGCLHLLIFGLTEIRTQIVPLILNHFK